MKIYLAGPMRGIEKFNFPAFFEAAVRLRADNHEVFNPAEADLKKYGPGVFDSDTGDLKDVKDSGFILREALAKDTNWICLHAEAIALLPGWEKSKGACAEKALAEALGLKIICL